MVFFRRAIELSEYSIVRCKYLQGAFAPMKTMNLDPNNVRPKMCKSCPFNLNGVEEIRQKVMMRSLTQQKTTLRL